jgi:hypothetical protein
MTRPVLLAALLLTAIPGAVRAQPAEAMRDVGFGEFTTNSFIRELPVGFRIPADYVAVSPEGQATRTYWMSRADSAAQAADPEHAMRDGFYSVALSLNVGYDADNDRFFSEAGDESTMKAQFEGQGFTGVSLERHLVNGYPVLFVEAQSNGRRAMLVYVASLVDTNAVYAFYTHPDQFRELDQARWDALKAAILASPPPAAPAR